MGRKEKSVNTSMSPAQSSIISKRTYTRQIQNKTINQTESSLNTANQPDNINMVSISYKVRTLFDERKKSPFLY